MHHPTEPVAKTEHVMEAPPWQQLPAHNTLKSSTPRC